MNAINRLGINAGMLLCAAVLLASGAGSIYGAKEDHILAASDAAANDQFGLSVALDVDTAIIGAPFGDNGSGSAYVFTRSGGFWTEQQKLVARDAAGG